MGKGNCLIVQRLNPQKIPLTPLLRGSRPPLIQLFSKNKNEINYKKKIDESLIRFKWARRYDSLPPWGGTGSYKGARLVPQNCGRILDQTAADVLNNN